MRIIYKNLFLIIALFAVVIGLASLNSKNNSQKAVEEYDAGTKKDMATMFEAQKKYHDLNGRYFLCGPFKGDGSCDGFDDSYPFGAIYPVLDNVPSSEIDKIYGVEQRDQWEYKGIDNTNEPQQFCYYAKLMNGMYITASPKGNFQRSARPWTFEECASTQDIPSAAKAANQKKEFTEHDNKRIADMDGLLETQKQCYANKGRYCPIVGHPNDGSRALNAGDENYTGKGGWRLFPSDPVDVGKCGQGYVYCDLNNQNDPQNFCYYAKLENGGFYAVSPKGGLKKESAPLNFQDCQVGKAKSLKLISPVGSEIWEAGKTYRIKWQSEAIDNVWISIINEAQNAKNGGTENYISPDFSGVPAAAGYYDWTINDNWIPDGDPAKYKIRISEYFDYETAISDRSGNNFTIQNSNIPDTAPKNGAIYPVKTQKDTCDGRAATGANAASWFVQNNCPAWKIYPVTQNKPVLIHVRSNNNGCKYPTLSLSGSNDPENDASWKNNGNLSLNLAATGMLNISFTPNTNYIKIDAKSCFYLDIYNQVPEILSQVVPFDAIKNSK